MIGGDRLRAFKTLCNPMPLVPGMCTSTMMHHVSSMRDEFRKSSADANMWAQYPTDLANLPVETRTDSSSSNIEMTGTGGGR